jgi:hypothetical protein
MVARMFRALQTRMTLVVVDEAGMSTVEYSNILNYTEIRRRARRTPVSWPAWAWSWSLADAKTATKLGVKGCLVQ